MPKTENQKQKILLIQQYLCENSDENHCVSASEIIEMLEDNGITAERKSIYADIEALKDYNMDIDIIKGRNGGFRLMSRSFEMPELKLLVDAIQSSRFITVKKSQELIRKISKLGSTFQRKELKRSVYITNRIKSDNESIYYNTDAIFNAINDDMQLRFRYFNYGADKKKHYHSGGQDVIVSPYALQYDDERYYMIAYDTKAKMIKHYRVDRMDNVSIEKTKRTANDIFDKFDLAQYSRKVVKMYSGDITTVTLKTDDSIAGPILDKFGNSCKFFPCGDGYYTVCIEVALSPTFYSWIFTFGDKIKIISPESAVDGYKKQLTESLEAMNF